MAVSADQEHSMLHRKPRILVVGSFVMDVIATTEQIPGAGQTVYGKSFHMAPGGKGANQALQCARLGAEVTMVDVVPEAVESMRRDGLVLELLDGVHRAPVEAYLAQDVPFIADLVVLFTKSL